MSVRLRWRTLRLWFVRWMVRCLSRLSECVMLLVLCVPMCALSVLLFVILLGVAWMVFPRLCMMVGRPEMSRMVCRGIPCWMNRAPVFLPVDRQSKAKKPRLWVSVSGRCGRL